MRLAGIRTGSAIWLAVATGSTCAAVAAPITVQFSGSAEFNLSASGQTFSDVPFTGSFTYDPAIKPYRVLGDDKPYAFLYSDPNGFLNVTFSTPDTPYGHEFGSGGQSINYSVYAENSGRYSFQIDSAGDPHGDAATEFTYIYDSRTLALPTGFSLQDGIAFAAAGVIDVFDGNGQVTRFGAVPEPASWALLICGFGLTGAGVRRTRVDAQHRSGAAAG